jgi:hypothetical protein
MHNLGAAPSDSLREAVEMVFGARQPELNSLSITPDEPRMSN